MHGEAGLDLKEMLEVFVYKLRILKFKVLNSLPKTNKTNRKPNKNFIIKNYKLAFQLFD